ncbi:MAG: DEAD/DEAH box helicase family protein [Candidatus Gastranaerophilales bacterium]|nr:DEAD/DEAH box helicase family protein [Candidatus Gastranaerophilales bacterium]
MKLKFKHQKFQADASKAVIDVFSGQPCLSSLYMIDRGYVEHDNQQYEQKSYLNNVGFCNHPIIQNLNKNIIFENLQKIQRQGQIEPSKELFDGYNLTVEMETGTGKTYTYIKTMFELNKHYGWTKFIIVVPSIAIREGVYKSFNITQEHFAEEYGKKIKFFIYNSSRLNEIEQFVNDGGLNVMIINSQAFNARGKDARRIYMKLDSFRSRRPIDVIAKTNPILIIDEPQSVEGAVTKERLKEFNPLITLRYSATPKERYNLVYRLDAIEAYNKKLVKKIAVKGVTIQGNDATNGYIYVQNINLYKDKAPTATIQYDIKGVNGIRKETKILKEGDNLFYLSNELDEYKNNYIISRIDGRDNTVTFLNGIVIKTGNVIGDINDNEIRRLQIRETILSHIARERKLFYKGIKVLSLFFIDEVAKYKQYDESNDELNGIYANMFEQEYENILNELQIKIGEDDYIRYLKGISAKSTHAGYFSIDKKGRITNSKEDKKEGGSNDVDAFDLIMKNKERLLSFDEPVRFIFSHSALREGWDNPNVFQICTLKKSSKDDKKRQEIGRGLRLCVNQNGERMDVTKLGETVHDINVLTVIANESYADFTQSLQSEIAEIVSDRPKAVDAQLFENKVITDVNGIEQTIDADLARRIYNTFIRNNYIDDDNKLTEAYYEAKKTASLNLPEALQGYEEAIVNIVDMIFDPNTMQPEDLNASKPKLELDREKLNKKEFQELWKRINTKTAYTVRFETDELIEKSIQSIDRNLTVTNLYSVVQTGSMDKIDSKETLQEGSAFEKAYTQRDNLANQYCGIQYDLIGKIVEETTLTRKSVLKILQGIREDVFNQFKINPEDFIIKISKLINEQKATVIIEHITYNKLEEIYQTDIFTEPEMKTITSQNSLPVEKNLYNYLIYDSNVEKQFGENLDKNSDVSVYVKLPKGFYINTPVGHYNPDWAIAFNEGSVKHIYFVAETKGSMETMQLKNIEKAKIDCARVHFKAISSDSVQYDVVDNYQSLLDKVFK